MHCVKHMISIFLLIIFWYDICLSFSGTHTKPTVKGFEVMEMKVSKLLHPALNFIWDPAFCLVKLRNLSWVFFVAWYHIGFLKYNIMNIFSLFQMSPYQYLKSHCGGKMFLRPSYLQHGVSYSVEDGTLWEKLIDTIDSRYIAIEYNTVVYIIRKA